MDSKPKIDMMVSVFVECASESNKWAANWKSPAHAARAQRSRCSCRAMENRRHDSEKEASYKLQKNCRRENACCWRQKKNHGSQCLSLTITASCAKGWFRSSLGKRT